jgi:flagellar biosynthesis/type III secretory pathway ATPase
MKNIIALAVVASLAACTSVPKETYEKKVYDENQRQEKNVATSVENIPKWMKTMPNSDSAVFATGSAVSTDLSMSEWKAKMHAFGKICVAAGGKIDQQGKIFTQENNETSNETSEMAIKTMCPSVDVTGVEIREVKQVAEGNRYRTYVLVALPTGDANLLQKRKDRLAAAARAQRRSDEAFRDLEDAVK